MSAFGWGVLVGMALITFGLMLCALAARFSKEDPS